MTGHEFSPELTKAEKAARWLAAAGEYIAKDDQNDPTDRMELEDVLEQAAAAAREDAEITSQLANLYDIYLDATPGHEPPYGFQTAMLPFDLDTWHRQSGRRSDAGTGT